MSSLTELVHTNNHQAQLAIIAEICTHWTEIVALADQRVNSVGVSEYGDASFHKTRAKLRAERFEEYADALFYYQVEQRQRE